MPGLLVEAYFTRPWESILNPRNEAMFSPDFICSSSRLYWMDIKGNLLYSNKRKTNTPIENVSFLFLVLGVYKAWGFRNAGGFYFSALGTL